MQFNLSVFIVLLIDQNYLKLAEILYGFIYFIMALIDKNFHIVWLVEAG